MVHYEYKVTALRHGVGIAKKGLPVFDKARNQTVKHGLGLTQMIMPADAASGTEQLIATLEREVRG